MEIGNKKTLKVMEGQTEFGRTTFEVVESGAFNYGNRTATVVQFVGADGHKGERQVFDTRYFHGTLDEFIYWYEKEQMRSDLHFEKE